MANANLEMPNTLDMNGKELILDADADTSITADTDDTIDVKVGGTDTIKVTGTQTDIKVSASRELNILKDSGDDFLVLKSTAPDASNNLRTIELVGETVAFATGASSGTSSTERMRINNSGLITSAPTASNTTSSSANMFITSGGEFAKSTSSQRHKNTINDATHGLTELLNLRSVTFKGNNDGDTIFGGLIAEEVHDAGLTEFVVYDDQNRPDALHYGSMVSLCIKAIQELKTELDNAKARITALENA